VVRVVRKSRFTHATEEAVRRRVGTALGGTVGVELALVDDLPRGREGGVTPVLSLVASAGTGPAGRPRREAVS
jgi:hypothetical protein